MKSLSKATFHLLCCILLLGTFQSCKDDETTPPPPGESATLTISDVKAEANTVTFTITPKNVDVYTYTIKSATVTPQATVQDPAETKTFTYNSLLPSSDYTIVATGFTQGGLELTSTEYKFRTLDTQDPGLEVPSGEEPFIEYGDQRIAAKSVFFYKETDRLWFFISPLEGYDNYQDMLYGNGGKNDYISLSFTPNQLNKSINMKSASERYSLLNSMSFQHPIASDISMVTIDYHSLITDGGLHRHPRRGQDRRICRNDLGRNRQETPHLRYLHLRPAGRRADQLHQPQRPENSARKRLLPTARRGNDFRNPSLAGQPRHGSADRPGG